MGTGWTRKVAQRRTLNISDYCGETNPGCPSSGTFVYNNTIYIGDTLAPEVRIKPGVGDFHCYNNLFVCESEGEIYSAMFLQRPMNLTSVTICSSMRRGINLIQRVC